jgi:hypothetical protein
MNKQQQQVEEFMRTFGQTVPSGFTPMDYPGLLRVSLIMEEAGEFEEALAADDWIGAIDAICDILYVTYGAASAMGIDIEPFFDEVHRSNMSKVDPETGRPIYREDGKVLKPDTYSPADLKKVLLKHYTKFFLAQAE